MWRRCCCHHGGPWGRDPPHRLHHRRNPPAGHGQGKLFFPFFSIAEFYFIFFPTVKLVLYRGIYFAKYYGGGGGWLLGKKMNWGWGGKMKKKGKRRDEGKGKKVNNGLKTTSKRIFGVLKKENKPTRFSWFDRLKGPSVYCFVSKHYSLIKWVFAMTNVRRWGSVVNCPWKNMVYRIQS